MCRPTVAFTHGEFVIDGSSKLGTLLELRGKCSPPEDDKARDTPSKMALAGEVHLAVRGLDDVGAWVRRIGERQQMP